MKIKEVNKIKYAKGQLKKLAEGKYHSLRYELTEYSNGKITIGCRVYIDRHGQIIRSTWDEALQTMRGQMERK